MNKNAIRMFVVIVAASLFLTSKVFALGGYSTLSGDDKTITDAIKENLGISENDAYNIYDEYVRSHFDTKDWSYNSYNNSSITSSKIKSSEVKFFHINVVTDNRFLNVSMHKYPKEKQIFMQFVETLPRQTNLSVGKYEDMKKDKEYEVVTDKDYFTVFGKTGYTNKTKILTTSGVGAIQYITFYAYDLNGK